MDLRNDKNIKNFINDVCSQVKCKEVHREISNEMEDHILSLAEEYMDSGYSDEVALSKAIEQMGDAFTIGRDLDKTHEQKPEWYLIVITSILSVIGLIALYFAQTDSFVSSPPANRFAKSVVFCLIGIAIAILFYFFDYRKLLLYSNQIYWGTIALLALTVFSGIDFTIRILGISGKIRDNYGRILIYGFSAIFAARFLWNILMVLGCAPISDVSLPFTGFNGQQFIVDASIIGICSSIYRHRTLTNTMLDKIKVLS